MPRVFVPLMMRKLTNGESVVEASGSTIQQVVAEMDGRFPGFKDRVCQNGSLRPGLSLVINGAASALGMLQKVQPSDEIHFLPAIGGG